MWQKVNVVRETFERVLRVSVTCMNEDVLKKSKQNFNAKVFYYLP